MQAGGERSADTELIIAARGSMHQRSMHQAITATGRAEPDLFLSPCREWEKEGEERGLVLA